MALQDSGLLSAGVHAAVLAGRLARIAVVVLASARLLALILAGLRASLRNRNHFELFLADGIKSYRTILNVNDSKITGVLQACWHWLLQF